MNNISTLRDAWTVSKLLCPDEVQLRRFCSEVPAMVRRMELPGQLDWMEEHLTTADVVGFFEVSSHLEECAKCRGKAAPQVASIALAAAEDEFRFVARYLLPNDHRVSLELSRNDRQLEFKVTSCVPNDAGAVFVIRSARFEMRICCSEIDADGHFFGFLRAVSMREALDAGVFFAASEPPKFDVERAIP